MQGTDRQGFRGLIAWQKADQLASRVYRLLNKAPGDQRWLASQAMRAAISVPANIAEGYARGSLGDYLRFLDIARGSLAEVDYYIHFLRQEGIIPEADVAELERLQEEASKVLHGLWKSLKNKSKDREWDHSGLIRETSAEYIIGEENGLR